VVDPKKHKTVCEINFNSYGSHKDDYPVPYLNAACAIGQSRSEIDTFIKRLDKTIVETKREATKRASAAIKTKTKESVSNVSL